jgi:hypothetical protein
MVNGEWWMVDGGENQPPYPLLIDMGLPHLYNFCQFEMIDVSTKTTSGIHR